VDWAELKGSWVVEISGDAGGSWELLRELAVGCWIGIGKELILGIKCNILEVILLISTELSICILINLQWGTGDIVLRVIWSLVHGLTRFFLFY
jgi:hypothetical protein